MPVFKWISDNVFAFCAVPCVAALTWMFYVCQRPHRFPSGPTIFPIIGSYMYVRSIRKSDNVLSEVCKQYGPIASFALGSRKIVVVSGYKYIYEALVNQAVAFAGRPRRQFLFDIRGNPHHLGIADHTYSPEWKAQRHVSMTLLRSIGYGQSTTEEKILEECQVLLAEMGKFGSKPFDPQRMIHISITNVICSLLFGERYEHSDKEFSYFLDVMDVYLKESLGHPEINFVPITRLFPSSRKFLKKYRITCQKMEAFLKDKVDKKRKTLSLDDQPNDLIQAYLLELEKVSKGTSKITEDWIVHITRDLFIAGTDTTTLTLQWCLLYMIYFPDVQSKVHFEIDRVLANKDSQRHTVQLSDRGSLTYIEAVLMECQRFCNLAPTTLPHMTTEDVEFFGYHLPRDTHILFCIGDTARDPELWEDPERFMPERFIGEDGTIQRPKHWIPFSLGRRMCLGEQLARQELFLVFVSIFQSYSISSPDDVSLKPEEQLTMSFPKSYRILATPRERPTAVQNLGH